MAELPEISDETVKVFLKAAHEAGAGAYITGGQGRLEVDDEHVRAGLAAALVASGYRREEDVLREVADRIDPGPVSTRRPANNDLDDMQMTCDRGVATRLRTWADVRERYRAHEPAQPLPVAAVEGQERSEERCPHCGRTSHGFACSESMGIREVSGG